MLHQPIHPGDADRGKQSADSGGNQAYQQRHQHRQRQCHAAILREGIQAHAHQHKDDGEPREQDAERDLVGGFLTLRAFHQRDHAIEEGLARVGGDLHLDPVRDDGGAAGDRAAIAAALANDRRRFSGDGGLVHGRNAFNHLAVARDDFAGANQHYIAAAQFGGGNHALLAVLEEARMGFGARLTEIVGLRLAAPFRHRFGKVREADREP